MKCMAIKGNGKQCGAYAISNSDFCFRHDKDSVSDALEASSNGGRGKKQDLPLGEEMSLKTPQDIMLIMEKSINKLWTGELPSNNRAGSIGYMARIFLDAHEKADLEERIEKLEKKLSENLS